MATHSSVLAWRIPGTEEPSGLPSLGSHRVGHDWSDLAAAAAARRNCYSNSWVKCSQEKLSGPALYLVTQLCPTLWDPMDHSPPDSSVHGILLARISEWVAMPSSRGSSQLRDWTQVSCAAGGFFTSWATREAPIWSCSILYLCSNSTQMRRLNKATLFRGTIISLQVHYTQPQ